MARNYSNLSMLKLHIADAAADVVGELGESFDTELTLDLETASARIDKDTGRWFSPVVETRHYQVSPSGTLFIRDTDLMTSPVPQVRQDIDGNGSYEITLATTDYMLIPRNRPCVQWVHATPLGRYIFTPGLWMQLEGTFGYIDDDGEQPPVPVIKATNILAARLFMRRHAIFGSQVIPESGLRETLPKDDSDVLALLAKYKHPRFLLGQFG